MYKNKVSGCYCLLLKPSFSSSSSRVMAAMSSLRKDLPDGFRLNPRDEDLIDFYLRRKLKNIPDPDGHCLIPELDIYLYHPQELIAVFDKMASIKSNGLECFFFCTLGKDPNRRCNIRKIAEGTKGFWHRTGKERKSQTTDKLEWARRIFSHRVGTHRNFEQTEWVMHEFRLTSDEKFVLCRITKKPKKFSASAGKKRKASVHMMGVQTPPLDISISDYEVDTLEFVG